MRNRRGVTEVDHTTLKKHLLRQILHHPDGISPNDLVEKTATAAGVPSDEHRDNILDWLNFLLSTGHVRRHGESITAEEVARLQFQTHVGDMMVNGTMWDPRLSEWLLHD